MKLITWLTGKFKRKPRLSEYDTQCELLRECGFDVFVRIPLLENPHLPLYERQTGRFALFKQTRTWMREQGLVETQDYVIFDNICKYWANVLVLDEASHSLDDLFFAVALRGNKDLATLYRLSIL